MPILIAFLFCLIISGPIAAEQAAAAGAVADPGPRAGPAGAGGPLPGVTADELALFNAAAGIFASVEDVPGGLGPRFNADSCGGCHAFPALGGTSPATNPQIAIATALGAKNTIPSFITLHGPVREARFINQPGKGKRQAEGGVFDLFVITGRSDAAGCTIVQPDFAGELKRNNVIFRIPTPVFGLGLVDQTPDDALIDDAAALADRRGKLGISGSFNHSGNDGTIARLGWKAQNKSLMMFAGEAYNVEMGVTNNLFPNEREDDPSSRFTPQPEDQIALRPDRNSGSLASDILSDMMNFVAFMTLSAPPTPAAPTASTTHGRQVFDDVGCGLCHTPQHKTAANVTYSPFSDFQIHTMGRDLADQINQGEAAGDQFRSAPLWGVGQRLFFLHDGRTADLAQAILAHSSAGSEANKVIDNFKRLPTTDQQDLLNFLRGL